MTVEGEPPLCKGRWIAEQDGGIVRKGVAAWGMVGERSSPLPGICVPRPPGEVAPIGDGEGVRSPLTNEVIQESTTPHPPLRGPPSPAGEGIPYGVCLARWKGVADR